MGVVTSRYCGWMSFGPSSGVEVSELPALFTFLLSKQATHTHTHTQEY